MDQPLVPYLYERETAYFGFEPSAFTDTIVNAVNHYSQIALDSLQEFVDIETARHVQPHSNDQLDLVSIVNEQGMQRAASLLESAMDKSFDRWELYCLRVIFHLPENYSLPHDAWMPSDEGQDPMAAQQARQAIQTAETKLEQLSEQLEMNRRMNKRLQEERKALEARTCLYNQLVEHASRVQQSMLPNTEGAPVLKDLLHQIAVQSKQLNELLAVIQHFEPQVDQLAHLKKALALRLKQQSSAGTENGAMMIEEWTPEVMKHREMVLNEMAEVRFGCKDLFPDRV